MLTRKSLRSVSHLASCCRLAPCVRPWGGLAAAGAEVDVDGCEPKLSNRELKTPEG